MELTVGAGAHLVVFLEGASEVLTAVVTGLEGNVRDREGAVDEKECRVLEAFLVNIICDRTVHVFREQGLQVGLIDAGMFCQHGNPDLLRQVGGDIIAGPFQVEHSGIFVVIKDAPGELQHHPQEQQTNQTSLIGGINIREVLYFISERDPALELADQILQGIAQMAGIISDKEIVRITAETGEGGAFAVQTGQAYAGLGAATREFQIQDRAGASFGDGKPVRYIGA